jgi:NAD-dependent dihydropyrimidine dehydrogenase PreA subunit
MALTQKSIHVVVLEAPDSDFDAGSRFATVAALLERGYPTSCTRQDGSISAPSNVPLLFLSPLENAPAPVAPENGAQVAFAPIFGLDASQVVEIANGARDKFQAAEHTGWKPWFPVIDYDRCTNCMQCLSFCLFGVYGVDGDKKIQVQNQDNCKTNCPACSRVCPEAAIMFPKYKAGPINGDQVSQADLQREKMKIDISALLGGDVYSMLRARSERAKSRFSKERDSDKALAERQKCLVKLAQAGDIPAEVLMSLPSPEEIARRAEEAAAKAQAALSS